MPEKIKTYIEGFDEELEGGIPEGHIVLISGPPGSMKSSLAYYILYHNAGDGLNGLYVTLEQSPQSILSQMEKLGMGSAEIRDKISIYDMGEERHQTTEEEFMMKQKWEILLRGAVEKAKKSEGISTLVIDSLAVYKIISGVQDVRLDLYELFRFLKGFNITIFIVSEMPLGSIGYGKDGEDFIVDGILHLKIAEIDDTHRQLRIGCPKMRGVNHPKDYFALMFADNKFQVTKAILE